MGEARVISASAAPYDGYSRNVMLSSLARIGFTHVEPAFIAGYTEAFDEAAFLPHEAIAWRSAIWSEGLSCLAISSHIDLGAADAVRIFSRRMDFSASVGAKVIISNATVRTREAAFFRNIESLLRHAEETKLVIALENPGDQSQNLFNMAADGIEIVRRAGSPHLRLNYDAANTVSHRPEVANFARDAIRALPASAHAHIKDVRRLADGWYFTPIGAGEVGCAELVRALARWPELPISIEMPLRIHRDVYARPVRNTERVELSAIEEALSSSLATLRSMLAFAAKAAESDCGNL